MSSGETTTRVYRRCASGDEDAAAEIYRRYGDDLCRMVEARISRRLRSRFDALDIVQAALRTFFRRAAAGQWKIHRQGQLWQLLVSLTLKRLRRRVEHETLNKRDVDQERPANAELVNSIADERPSPEHVVELMDEMDFVLGQLQPVEKAHVRLWLAETTVNETASTLGCSRSTVHRIRERIRRLVSGRLDSFAK